MPKAPPAASAARDEIDVIMKTFKDNGRIGLACGPASLALVLQILGMPIDNAELSSLADRDGETDLATMARYLESKGLFTAGARIGPEALSSFHGVAILQVLAPASANGERPLHFLVSAGPAQAGKPRERYGASEVALNLFDPVAADNARGPFPLHELSEFYTGNALLIARHPLDLSQLAEPDHDNGQEPRHAPISVAFQAALGVIATAIGVSFLAIVRRKWRARRHAHIVGSICLAAVPVVLGLPSCARHEDKATAPVPAAAATMKALVVVGADTYREEAVHCGARVKHTFELRNVSGRPVQCRLDQTSCGCLTARFVDDSFVPPGKSVFINAELTTSRGGEAAASVPVEADGAIAGVLRVGASVKGDLQVTPKLVEFGTALPTTEALARRVFVTYFSDTGETFRIIDAVPTADWIRVVPDTLTDLLAIGPAVKRTTTGISILLDPKASPAGSFSALVRCKALAGGSPVEFSIMCTGTRAPAVTVVPAEIVRIGAALLPRVEQQITIWAPGHSGPPVVADISADGVGIRSWSQHRFDDHTTVNLDVSVELVRGRCQGGVKITFDDPSLGTTSVPVRVVSLQ